ncbi:MAG: hypothetical protein HEQ38_20575 [Gemmatimonas sp.]|nr:hypothetical protein [Gemmatimonas sp.]
MFQGYKTYLASLALLVIGALPEVLAGTDWQQFMVDPKTGAGLIVGSVVMIVMRKVTSVTTVKKALETPPPSEGA